MLIGQHVSTVANKRLAVNEKVIMREIFVSIRERIDTLQKVMGVTQAELSEHLGISRVMLHYLRTGKRSPGRNLVSRIEQSEKDCGILTAYNTASDNKSMIASDSPVVYQNRPDHPEHQPKPEPSAGTFDAALSKSLDELNSKLDQVLSRLSDIQTKLDKGE